MTAPAAPVISMRGATEASVRLRWAAVTGAATYNVYRDGVAKQTGLTGTSTVIQASQGDALTVTAVNAGAEESAASNSVSIGALSGQGARTEGGRSRGGR